MFLLKLIRSHIHHRHLFYITDVSMHLILRMHARLDFICTANAELWGKGRQRKNHNENLRIQRDSNPLLLATQGGVLDYSTTLTDDSPVERLKESCNIDNSNTWQYEIKYGCVDLSMKSSVKINRYHLHWYKKFWFCLIFYSSNTYLAIINTILSHCFTYIHTPFIGRAMFTWKKNWWMFEIPLIARWTRIKNWTHCCR